MNKIVVPHYPVERLPGDLKEAVRGAETVTVTLEPQEAPAPRRSFSEIYADVERLRREGKIRTISPEEAVARIRALRDEWDD